jgi:protein gp37
MSENSAIEWTDNSWSPIRARGTLGRHYCLKISPGCQRCYAGTFNRRLGGQDYAEVSEETIRLEPTRA